MSLDTEFTQRMRDACDESTRLGYTPTRMMGMLATSSGPFIAKKMVRTGELQYGLKSIFALGRGDLAIESIMLEAKFRPLFTNQELAAAQWRIDQVK